MTPVDPRTLAVDDGAAAAADPPAAQGEADFEPEIEPID
jgi:hypothetical protein